VKFTSILIITLLTGISLSYAQPSLENIGGNTYEFPFAYNYENPLFAKIQLKNKGDRLLRVEYIKPSCSCTSAPLEKSTLEPGETMVMNVKIDMKGFKGKVSKTVEIKTNDPEEPITVLTFVFEVKFPLELSPRGFFAFGKLKIDSLSKSKLKMKNTSEQKIVISDFVIKPEDVKFSLKGKKVLKPGQEIELELSATPKIEGPYSCSVQMKTTNLEVPELIIYGSGRVPVTEKEKPKTEEEKPKTEDVKIQPIDEKPKTEEVQK
jgi:hypothetical protein